MIAGALAPLFAAAAVALAGAGRARSRRRGRGPGRGASEDRWSPGGRPAGSARSYRGGLGPARHARTRQLGGALIVASAAAAIALLGPALSVALIGSAALVRVELVRRTRHRARRASDAAFPDLVDLFRIAAAAGHPVHRCLEVVASRAPVPVRPPLADALTRVNGGVPLADALVALGPDLGTSGPVLADALRAALRTGSPLGPVLDRVVLVARDRRTRNAQTAARRLPVTMLFPLVLCVLPAFGLLGVVPLLAGSLGSLAP